MVLYIQKIKNKCIYIYIYSSIKLLKTLYHYYLYIFISHVINMKRSLNKSFSIVDVFFVFI